MKRIKSKEKKLKYWKNYKSNVKKESLLTAVIWNLLFTEYSSNDDYDVFAPTNCTVHVIILSAAYFQWRGLTKT